MTPSLARNKKGRAGVERCLHPGLVSLPGSQSVLETLGPILLPVGEPRGGALSPDGRRRTFSRENLSLTLRDQPASDALREGSEALPCVGSLHGSNHEASHVREVVKVCREFGNVCRA